MLHRIMILTEAGQMIYERVFIGDGQFKNKNLPGLVVAGMRFSAQHTGYPWFHASALFFVILWPWRHAAPQSTQRESLFTSPHNFLNAGRMSN